MLLSFGIATKVAFAQHHAHPFKSCGFNRVRVSVTAGEIGERSGAVPETRVRILPSQKGVTIIADPAPIAR